MIKKYLLFTLSITLLALISANHFLENPMLSSYLTSASLISLLAMIVIYIIGLKGVQGSHHKLLSENNDLHRLCQDYRDKISHYENTQSRLSENASSLSKRNTGVIQELEHMDCYIVFLSNLMQAISDKSLEDTNNAMASINDISKSSTLRMNTVVQSLKRVICDDSNDKTSFKCVEESALRLKGINVSLDSIAMSQKSEDHYLNQVESKIANIQGFTKEINDISETTHVLSINASIEAARSGKHAKGFSIIAGQIKKLAGEAKKSVEDINKMTHEASKAIHDLKAHHKNVSDKLSEQIDTSKVELDDIFDVLSRSYNEIVGNMNSLTDFSNESMNGLNNVVFVYGQSQDITSQQVAHIQQIIESLKNRMTSIQKDLDRDGLNLDTYEIRQKVLSETYDKLTMSYERESLKKAALEHMDMNLAQFTEITGKGSKNGSKSKDLMEGELTDSIVLF
ncbi:MAG: hypothetical protein IEMM0008_0294 [bacterium]|nr:MAG: hypothetical protein IEMM0008_0294 [bacterium]